MLLKEIGRKIAQTFRSARAADEKVASSIAAAYALRRFAESLKPEPLSHLTNNWRKMHGLPMHRKPVSFRRKRKSNGTGKQSK